MIKIFISLIISWVVYIVLISTEFAVNSFLYTPWFKAVSFVVLSIGIVGLIFGWKPRMFT